MRFTTEGSPGTVIIAQGSLGRYIEFEMCLERLVVPTGTVQIRARSGSMSLNCNRGVNKRKGEWVFFIDDDHTFEPDVLMRLLAHNKDIVAPLVPMRYPPYELVLYKMLEKYPKFQSTFYKMSDLDGISGLIKVEGLPKSGGLFREKVWQTMPYPWFRMGEINPDEIDDDRVFMYEARHDYGFELWCDTDQVINHMTTVAIGCARTNTGVYRRSMSVYNNLCVL